MHGVVSAEWIKGGGRFASRPHPWVARLTGLDPRFTFQREFVKGVYDYTYARRSQSRGVMVYFFLAPGLYDVFYPTSWKHERRYFIRVDEHGDIHEIEREKVIQCLKNDISESAS